MLIIGPGLDGLITGALLGKERFKVIYITNDRPVKGMATPLRLPGGQYSRANYILDCRDGALGVVLRNLGIDLDYKHLDPVDRIVLPSFEVQRPGDWVEYKRVLAGLFPNAVSALEKYFSDLWHLGREWLFLINGDGHFNFASFPYMARYFRRTFLRYVEELFTDPVLKSLLLVGVPASDISLPVMAGHLIGQVFDGCYLKGGLSEIVEMIYSVFKEAGGEVIEQKKVKTILVNGHLVTGIELEDGEKIPCSCLVSTYDERTTYLRYLPQLSKLQDGGKPKHFHGLSYFNAYYVLEKGWESPFQPVRYYSTLLSSESLKTQEEGEGDAPLWCTVYPECFDGHQFHGLKVVTEISPLHYYKWLETNRLQDNRGNLEAYEDHVIQQLSTLVKTFCPELCLNPVGGISPRRFGEFSDRPEGQENSWAFSVEQILKNPLYPKSALGNLVVTGLWGWAWFTSALVATRAVKRIVNQ